MEHVNGEWLWLKAEKSSVAGWIESQYVLPYERAIEYYTGLIRSSSHASYYHTRGNVWKEKGEYDIAIADYSEAIRMEPGEVIHWDGRGDARRAKGEYDKAIADYGEAIRLDPKYAGAYYNRGMAWHHKKEYDRAIAEYGEAIRLDPRYNWAYNNRAWIWATCPDEKFRDGKRAVESATRACELSGWKDAADLDTLAAAYAEAGDFDKAVEMQEKAVKLASDEGKKAFGERLNLYRDKKPYRDTN